MLTNNKKGIRIFSDSNRNSQCHAVFSYMDKVPFNPRQCIDRDSSNCKCADCDSNLITHLDLTKKITLCRKCARIHQDIEFTNSHVKEIEKLSREDETIVSAVSNASVNEKYLKNIPYHFKKITPNSASILRLAWITSKYIGQSFSDNMGNDQSHYKSGILYVRDQRSNIYTERWFDIRYNECSEGLLCYSANYCYAKKYERAINIHETDLNFVPHKMGQETGLQIDFLEDNVTKSIYVYTERRNDIIEWYHTLRFCKLSILERRHLHCERSALAELISSEIVKEGLIKKSGPSRIYLLRSRWFTLLKKKHLSDTTEWIVRYYENPLDLSPKGEIILGRKSEGYKISYSEKEDVTLILSTPKRRFNLVTESVSEQDSWKECFEKALDESLQIT